MHYPSTLQWLRLLNNFFVLIFLSIAPFMAAQAQTGNAANGKTTYNAILATGKMSCANATCHTIDPTRNQNKIRPAGYTEASIKTAISRGLGGVSEMNFLSPLLTTQNIADLAAYIFNPAAATGGGTPTAALSPASVAFGSSTVGTAAATQTVTVSNTGTAALALSGISTGSSEFVATGGTCTSTSSIAAAGSCTVILTFTPSAAGARSATLTVSHNATPASSTLGLSGTGVAVVVTAPVAQVGPASLSFGSATVGTAASPAQTVTVSNTGTAPLVLSGISTASTEFAVSGGTCSASGSIAPNANCTINLTFTPSAAGARSATLTVSHNATPASSAVALSGTGVAVVVTTPGVTVAPATLSFGTSTIGTATGSQNVTVTSTGSAALNLSAISTGSSEFVVSGGTCTASSSLPPSTNCAISITFTPSAAGARSATLTVSHNASGGSSTAGLSGTGTAVVITAPIAQLTPTTLSFGSSTVGTATATQTVTVGNTGNAPLVLSSIATASTEFAVSGGTCTASSSIAPGANCSIVLGFTPSAAGARSATLTVSHNGTGGSSAAALSGTGVAVVVLAPIAQVAPTSVSFGTLNVGAASVTQSVIVTNAGTTTLTLSGIATGSTEFAIGGGTCSASSTVASSASCTILLAFTPNAVGLRSATLTIGHNAVSGSATVALTGTGAAVVLNTPSAQVAPSSISFGSSAVGVATASQSVTVSNSGTAALVVSGMSTASTEFVITGGTCVAGGSVAATASCTVTLTFTPGAAGARTATLTVSHNAISGSSTVSLSGTGTSATVAAPIAQLAPTSLAFPAAVVGASSANQTVTLSNTGTAALIISGVATGSTEFPVTGGTCSVNGSVAVGTSCTINIGFTANAVGARNATLTVSHNAAGGNSTASLSGVGTAAVGPAALQLSSTWLSFAASSVGTTSASQTVTVSNVGGSPLTLGAIVITGGEFSVAFSTCAANLVIASGANCVMSLNFTPSVAGARSASLSISHNATGSTSLVSLTGTGTAAVPVTLATKIMTEYRYVPLNYFFITSRDSDKAVLDTYPGWERTGESFHVYTSQVANSHGINRYYFDQVAMAKARGSHLYTLLGTEIVLLQGLNPGNIYAPRVPFDEGVDSYAMMPVVEGVGGSCAVGQVAVYRFFRGNVHFPDDPNHRFTTSSTIYNEFVNLGWDGEGVKLCVPAQ